MRLLYAYNDTVVAVVFEGFITPCAQRLVVGIFLSLWCILFTLRIIVRLVLPK